MDWGLSLSNSFQPPRFNPSLVIIPKAVMLMSLGMVPKFGHCIIIGYRRYFGALVQTLLLTGVLLRPQHHNARVKTS